MSGTPTNIANRIAAGLDAKSPPDRLLLVASEATAQGIQAASANLLRAWAIEVKGAAGEMSGRTAEYWLSVANELEHLAHERCKGVE